jgi:CHASE2 domain-containing sensor protein
MKRLYLIKESFWATIMMLVITFCISYLPIKFEFAKPIRQGFLGFDIYDLYYSGKHLKNTKRDTNIVIVEIGNDRTTIADQISLIQKYSPAIIGIDAIFDKEGESLENIKLLQAISRPDNIIFASKYDYAPETGRPAFIHNFFEEKDQQYQSGYINIVGSQFSVIRNYPPFLKIDDSIYSSFTSVIANKFSPEKLNKLKKRRKKLEVINYKGNLESYTSLTKEQLLHSDTTGQLRSLLSQKIVLLGYFDKEEPFLLEDLHFSPLNEEIAGKNFPDMYGVVIHANILSMILKGNYVNQASDFVSYLLAGLITFLFLLFVLWRYKKHKHPKHYWLLLAQFLAVFLVLYIFLQVFNWFHIKVPLLPIMVSLALCVELLDIYKALAVRLHKKYGYKTVFTNK